MAESQRQYLRNVDGVHLNAAFSDYTLCGDAMEGDSQNDLEAVSVVPRGPVTCPRCIEIINHCRGVRTKDQTNEPG